MSSFMHSRRRQPDVIAQVSIGSSVVPGSIAILLAALLTVVFIAPPALILPVMALAATGASGLAGLAAWLSQGANRARALTSAGIFALAAIASTIIGDPDQVAIFLK